MPWLDIIWTEEATEKIAAHGVRSDEAEYVLMHGRHMTSHSSGRPLAVGRTEAGRWLIVVYQQVDTITALPITAYEPD